MWIIRSKADPEKIHILLHGRPYSLGRRDTDILLLNDMSISRKHATLRVVHPEAHVMFPEKLPVLTLEDSSKFGTVIGEKRINKEQVQVKDGDLIWFGNLNADTSQYIASYQPYLVTTSCLAPAAKKQVRLMLSCLGGHMTNEWHNDCDILLMTNLSITVKVICALICQKPIVTPKYLQDLIQALKIGAKQPMTKDYLPPLDEAQLDPAVVSFEPNEKRQQIFKGMKFIFLSRKQFKKMKVAINVGGGISLLMDESSSDVKESILLSPKTCVVSCDINAQSQELSQSSQNWIAHVMTLLKSHKKRSIRECEIGYAVLFCSTDTHCNPDVMNYIPGSTSCPQTMSQAIVSQHTFKEERVQETSSQSVVKVKTEPSSWKEDESVPASCQKQDKRKRNHCDRLAQGEPQSLSDMFSLDDDGLENSDDDMFASVPEPKRQKVTDSPIHPKLADKQTTKNIHHSPVHDRGKVEEKTMTTELVDEEYDTTIPNDNRMTFKSGVSISKPSMDIDDDFVDKKNISSKIIIQVVDLVVKKPVQKAAKNKTGNGATIKNFKKFKKVYCCDRLPHIIGESDLVPWNRKHKGQLDKWFDDYSQSQSQETDEPEKDGDLDFVRFKAGKIMKRNR